MPIQPDQSAETSIANAASNRWCIEGALTIGTIAEWHGRFTERTATATELEVDLTGVTAADVFGIQLLCSARRSAIESGRVFKITAIPPVVQAAASSTGFHLES